ncbi:MAG: response regulator [Anaerolineales bacterium]
MPKILVAEDQVDLREMIILTLRMAGFDVVAAEDGEQAYQQAKASRPDLLILDLDLPYLSGAEVCKKLKARQDFARTPIVIISSHDNPAEIEKSMIAGAQDYIRKPFELNQLMQRVTTLLA